MLPSSVVEHVEVEVLAGALVIGVTLRRLGEVLEEEDLAGLSNGIKGDHELDSIIHAIRVLLTFLKNQNILNGQKPGKALKRSEFGWGVLRPSKGPNILENYLLFINPLNYFS